MSHRIAYCFANKSVKLVPLIVNNGCESFFPWQWQTTRENANVKFSSVRQVHKKKHCVIVVTKKDDKTKQI